MLIGIAVSVIAFTLIAPALASPYTSTLSISNNGKIWRVPFQQSKEVTGAVAKYYWNDTSVNPNGEIAGPVILTWARMQKHNDGITLYFDPQVIQEVNDEVLYTVVDVYVGSSVTPRQGPAFAWGRTR
jgi:hypothetical protein